MKNLYEINKYYAEIIIDSKKYGIIKAKIDNQDIERCKEIKWYYAKNKDSEYIEGTYKGKKVKLHRYILNAKEKQILIDHINRNTLDNRKSNLRLATNKENSFNKSIRSDNKSGYSGVDLRNNKWRAKIKYNGITIHLGYFIDKDEAILNRQLAEQYLFKEFSPSTELISYDTQLINKAKVNVMKRINLKVA
ncbi:HNH endonuclease [Clostridium baratii]|uniref:HNH endonuclease n=1 Tax=Clostridium baratii TaxID=1561 RepID=UPI0030CFB294